MHQDDLAKAEGVARNRAAVLSPRAGEAAVQLPKGRAAYRELQAALEELHAAEEALGESEERFRTAFAHAPLGMAITDLQGRFLQVNPVYCAITGYTESELVATDFQSITHPDDLAGNLQCMRQMLTGEISTLVLEKRYIRKDGEVVWVLNHASVVRDSQGALVNLIALTQDITQRKQAEEEIRWRNKELAALNAITAAVNSSLKLSEVLTTVKRQVAEQLNIPAGALLLYEEAKDRLCLQAHWGLPEAMRARYTASSSTGVHDPRALREKIGISGPVYLPVAAHLTQDLDRVEPEWASYLSLPLLAKGAIQGVLDLYSPTGNVFRTDRVPFFEALGRQIGVAIQNARLFEEVRVGREHLQALSRRLVEVQETERSQIARELHDEVGQLLTGLKLTLEMGARLPMDTDETAYNKALALVNELMVRVREMSLDLRPAMLDDLGLLPTLWWFFERYTAQTGVQVYVSVDHVREEQRFAAQVETTAYRIIQEALTNVARHAGVREANVHISSDDDILRVQIEDRGGGFVPRAALTAGRSGGLAGMHERAKLLGGRLMVASAPGAGARLTAELPLERTILECRKRER